MFNNKLFKQVDNVAMRSLLSPFYFNFFLGYLEHKYIIQYNDVKPKFYVCYVDDKFVLFNDKSHIERFTYL